MAENDQAGARPGGGGKRPEPRGDDFVSRLVSDPAKPPEATLLSGYLGASDEEGHTRVYLAADLSDYVDVADDDVLHTEAPRGDAPLAATLVWIRRDAQVLHGKAGAARQRAGFFEGRIWRENVGATGTPGGWFAQGGPGGGQFGPARPGDFQPAPSLLVACMHTISPAFCRTRIPILCKPIPVSPWCPPPRSYCPPGPGPLRGPGNQWVQGSGGAADTVAYGSGGGSDTVFYGSGGTGADTVFYGGTGSDTVFYGSGTGTDTVFYGSGTGADTVFYGSGAGTDTVHYGSGVGTDTVHYGSGAGTDTVHYGQAGILPTEWCPSAALPCVPPSLRCPPRTPFCPPSVLVCPTVRPVCRTPVLACPTVTPRTACCGPSALPQLCPSAVDACPTRYCPPW